MFEDLISEKKSIDNEKQCPYCKSYYINKGSMKIQIDDKWVQPTRCNMCHRTWNIIYSEDMSKSWVEVDKGV